MACCPVHDDRTPSLSITEDKTGKVLVRCHAGCGQSDVIETLRSLGLWGPEDQRRSDVSPKSRVIPVQPDPEVTQRTEKALAIWRQTQPLEGTLGETYLRSRGLNLLPPSLRFHTGLKHRSGRTYPAIVALITRGADAAPVAIHRTFLAPSGEGKAPVDAAKMMLGPCRGGVARLGPPTKALMLGEGIETCLAAMQATGHAAWAALSTSGLLSLDLPSEAQDLILLADGDDAGERAAQTCALRWKREGRRVRIARPPKGMDFNDLLIAYTLSDAENEA
jgi:hypothetical protein